MPAQPFALIQQLPEITPELAGANRKYPEAGSILPELSQMLLQRNVDFFQPKGKLLQVTIDANTPSHVLKILMRQLSGEILKLYDGKKKFLDAARKFFHHVKKLPDEKKKFPGGEKKFVDVARKFFRYVKKLPDEKKKFPDGKKKFVDVARKLFRHMKKLSGVMKKFADEKIKCHFLIIPCKKKAPHD